MRRRPGFTLTETLVALALIGLLAGTVGLSWGALQRGLARVALEQSARHLTADLRAATRFAIASGRAVRVVLRPLQGGVEIPAVGVSRTLPDAVSMQAEGAVAAGPEAGEIALMFWPDGRSSGLEVLLRTADASRRVQVHWLTSRVTHAPG